jgi:hypothetical protein
MWINFNCYNGKKYVVRPFLGGVNGITGEGIVGDMGSLLRKMNKVSPTQDYLILPEQRWLDGISTRPGIVRQFVASQTTPPRQTRYQLGSDERSGLTKSKSTKAGSPRPHSITNDEGTDRLPLIGSSVEWQVTGRDAVGGIQLQIIPTFDIESMHAGSIRDACPRILGNGNFASFDARREKKVQAFDVLKTPKELGMAAGDCLHIKDLKSRKSSRAKTVADLLKEGPQGTAEANTLDLEIDYLARGMEIILKILGGRTTYVRLEQSDTIFRLKEKVEQSEGIPKYQQKLIFSGRQLEDHQTAAQYGITEVSIFLGGKV